MLNYEQFKEEIIESIKDYMPDEYKDYKINFHEVQKVNVKMEGISMSGNDIVASPTIYFEELYDEYKENEDLDYAIQNAANLMISGFKNIPEINYSEMENRIVMELINTKQNKELLKNVPSRKFNDLSIIYRWIVDMGSTESGIASAIITNEFAEKIEMDEETLYQAAYKNTERMFPAVIMPLEKMIALVIEGNGIDLDFESMNDVTYNETMWVITNNENYNGAATMLYEDKIHTLSEKMGTDLYILPSSIHEVIAVSTDFLNPKELSELVKAVNSKEVLPEDILSDSVYHYDKNKREIKMAVEAEDMNLKETNDRIQRQNLMQKRGL